MLHVVPTRVIKMYKGVNGVFRSPPRQALVKLWSIMVDALSALDCQKLGAFLATLTPDAWGGLTEQLRDVPSQLRVGLRAALDASLAVPVEAEPGPPLSSGSPLPPEPQLIGEQA